MILFLDFDGVLHPVSGAGTFDPGSISILESVVSDFPKLMIVVTSSWREEKSIDQLKSLLGEELGGRVIGSTPVIDEPFLHNVRYHEVCTYLETVKRDYKAWVAIDDEIGNYPEGMPVLITDRRSGLTPEDGLTLRSLISAQLK